MANVNLLQTASLASMQPLTISGQLVINSYWQIKDELRTLGPQHAALLSEPTLNSQLGEVDWTSDLPGTPARLTALQGEDRKAAEDTLAKLCADVKHHINQLDATGDTAKLQRAKALRLALEVVSESDIFRRRRAASSNQLGALAHWAISYSPVSLEIRRADSGTST